jgi:hypothetical protein
MHHEDLAWIRAIGGTNTMNLNLSYSRQTEDLESEDISAILAKNKPHIVVDENGG